MATNKRNPGMDIVRCICVFLVIFAHGLLNIGFYAEPINNFKTAILVYPRSLCMAIVPLFLMISGYFIKTSAPSIKYYTRIFKIYITYVLAGTVCFLCRIFVLHEHHTIMNLFRTILSFEAAPYAWYIHMYVGLFLLIPFLNSMFNGLQKQARQVLIVSLMVMTVLPPVTNIYNLTSIHWWLQPSSLHQFQQLIPAWWVDIYPLTYFFIGSYLREHPLKCKQSTKLLLFLGANFLAGTNNIYRSYPDIFVWGWWAEVESLFTLLQAIPLFSLFQGMNFDSMKPRACRIWQWLSELVLGAYLVSWAPEQVFAPMLNARYSTFQEKLPFLLPLVLLVLVSSFVLSWLISLLAGVLNRWAVAIFLKIFDRNAAKA